MKRKIALIGGGNIGGTIAFLMAMKEVYEIVILDLNEGLALGKALDIGQSLSVMKKQAKLVGTCNYKDIQDSDLVIITAGSLRKPGMSRDVLLNINSEIIKNVAKGVREYAPNAFVIIITNPLDAMVYAFLQYSNFSRKKVVGMAGVLDSARFNFFLSRELNISIKNVTSSILGEHGDTMVPCIKYTHINGIPLAELIDNGLIKNVNLEKVIKKTKFAGTEIVQLFNNASAFYAPATSTVAMAEAYLNNSHQIFICSVLLKSEYDLNDICIGVPIIIGKNGVKEIIKIDLSPTELELFTQSAKKITKLINTMKTLMRHV